ncbi:Ger(x)C family spore germination protein [Metabacillus herbersteinensis]|uniref:Ger(X)C family spore germination protein n=1 Tax=Metabacillus herbersteinensis TaxID=283816 RepID=A0ABV6GKW9_9BACI
MKVCKLLFCMMLIFLAGCWDQYELDEISIVSGIAIEKGEGKKYKLTVAVINATQLSKQSAEGNTPIIAYDLEGNSISELTNKMNQGMMRKLVYSHTRVIVIDEEVAREGTMDFLDFLERTGEFRNDFNILVAKGVKASDVITTSHPVQKIPAIKINVQIDNFLKDWGGDPHVQLTDFIDAITSEVRDPVTQVVTVAGDPEAGNKVENLKSMEPLANVVLEGISVFKKDRLIGFLSVEEARDYLWTQDLERTTVTVPCNRNDAYLDIRIVNSHTTKNISYKNEQLKIAINIKGEARLQGSQCADNLEKLKTYESHQKKLQKHIENSVQQTIQKVQTEYGVDIFGFGSTFERQNYPIYKKVKKDWDELFSKAEVEVNVDMSLRRSGIRNRSFLTDLKDSEKE